MSTRLEKILAFIKPIIERGQTNVIIAMMSIVALSAFAYYDGTNAVYYGGFIVVVACVSMIIHVIEGKRG